ncbi:MAG TPA: DUF3455 domain-containing protein [Methylocella sp.]|nr:DUF3455 domain-containing protein [Methylocella sp.]
MRQIFATMLLAAFSSGATAQDALAPPPGARKLFELRADGVQIYACKPTDQGFGWVFEAPEAVLFGADGKRAGTHLKGPTWVLVDGSSVTGELSAKQASPKSGSIPWLLLKVKTHQGKGELGPVTFIRRVNTEGGAQPLDGCDSAHKDENARVPYSATYEFFGP